MTFGIKMSKADKLREDNDPTPVDIGEPFASPNVVSRICLYGAAAGDIFGSTQNEIRKLNGDECRTVDIFQGGMYTDVTIMNRTVLGVLHSIGDDPDGYSDNQIIKQFSDAYKNMGRLYPKLPYGVHYYEWARGDAIVADYHSFGNGAAVRAPVIGAFYCNWNENAINRISNLSAVPTHLHLTAIKAARVAAMMAYYAARGVSKDEIVRFGSWFYKEEHLNPDRYKVVKKYVTADCTMDDLISGQYQTRDLSCDTAMSLVLIAIRESNTYEDCLRSILKYLCDTNTIMAIAGGIFALIEAAKGVSTSLQGHTIDEIWNRCTTEV